jgi:hypothetical protein
VTGLVALIKAILEWLTDLANKDVRAGDADTTPQSLKDRWRRRIKEQEKNEEDSNPS